MVLHLLPVPVHTMVDYDHLRDAFGKVCNKENWKYPIDAIVEADMLIDTIRGITFMTGGATTVTPRDDGRFHITSPGYYAVIGP